nr:hypothetical protein [Candidatus Absconditicoccus praedator]
MPLVWSKGGCVFIIVVGGSWFSSRNLDKTTGDEGSINIALFDEYLII